MFLNVDFKSFSKAFIESGRVLEPLTERDIIGCVSKAFWNSLGALCSEKYIPLLYLL